MLTRQEINELADSELNNKLWELSGFDNSKLKLSQSGIMYTHSLDGQFNFAKVKKLKYAVLFSPNPELDWEGEADQNYIFLYDSIEGGQEEISNSLRAGAEILLWLSQKR